MVMSVEQLVEWGLAGEPKYSEKTCLSATLSTTNPKWHSQGSKQGRRCGKPGANCLSYGTVLSWNSRGVTEEYHRLPETVLPVFRPKFEPNDSEKQIGSVTAWVNIVRDTVYPGRLKPQLLGITLVLLRGSVFLRQFGTHVPGYTVS
jgi:hypothetical protein